MGKRNGMRKVLISYVDSGYYWRFVAPDATSLKHSLLWRFNFYYNKWECWSPDLKQWICGSDDKILAHRGGFIRVAERTY